MPKQPINYDNTYFYKIVCRDLNVEDMYVGHTTDFRRRKNSHKTRCQNEGNSHYNCKVYTFIRDNGGWNNWVMVLICKCKCDDSLDAGKKERQYIEELNATLNIYLPSQTAKEYYASRKEHFQKYREDKKDYIKEWQSIKHKCECGGAYTSSNKVQHIKTMKHQQYLQSLETQSNEIKPNDDI